MLGLRFSDWDEEAARFLGELRVPRVDPDADASRCAAHAPVPVNAGAGPDLIPGSVEARHAVRKTSDLRLTLTRVEAARTLGISMDSFERYVQPEVRAVVRGRLRLYPLAELERWIEENTIPPAVAADSPGRRR